MPSMDERRRLRLAAAVPAGYDSGGGFLKGPARAAAVAAGYGGTERSGQLGREASRRRRLVRSAASRRCAAARSSADLASNSCGLGSSPFAFDSSSTAIGNRSWRGSGRPSLARRGAGGQRARGRVDSHAACRRLRARGRFVRRRRRRGTGRRVTGHRAPSGPSARQAAKRCPRQKRSGAGIRRYLRARSRAERASFRSGSRPRARAGARRVPESGARAGDCRLVSGHVRASRRGALREGGLLRGVLVVASLAGSARA